MNDLNQDQIESIAETVESDPSNVSENDLETLLHGIEHSDYKIESAASDALEELVDNWSDERILEYFNTDLLDGRLQADSVTGGRALSNVVGTLAENEPEQVRPIGRQVGLGTGAHFHESDAKEALCKVFTTDELASEAEALINANDSTPRNVGVRIVKELGAEGYELDETDPDAAEAVLPAVWELARNRRENSKPRENAIEAMSSHAQLQPVDHVDNVGEIIELLHTTKSRTRSALIDYLIIIAEHDPDTVVPTVPLVRREFDDKTASYGTLSSAAELIAQLVESHPVVAPPLDPFVQRIKDEGNGHDEDDVKIVAAAGEIDHLKTMLTAEKYIPKFGANLADSLKDDSIVFEELQDLCFADDPGIRYNAVSTIVEEFNDRVNVPVSLYLDLLEDDTDPIFPTSHDIAGKAREGIEKLASTDPDQLVDAVPKLREALQKSFSEGDRYSVSLSRALGHIARADQDTYAQLAEDLTNGDEYVQCAAVAAISGETEVYPAEFDDPVPALLDIYHSHYDGDISIGGEVLSALGGLAYSRPDALEGAIDFLLERYEENEDVSGFRRYTADFAGEYPSELTELIEELANNYTDAYSGDYKHDASKGAIALAHLARDSPEEVREAVAELAERPPDERPPSFPLIHAGLGDHDEVPSTWSEEDGWLSDQLVNGSERTKLKLMRVLAKSDYTPVKELLATVRDDESATDFVRQTATEAIE